MIEQEVGARGESKREGLRRERVLTVHHNARTISDNSKLQIDSMNQFRREF